MTDLVRKVCTRGREFLAARLPLAIVLALFAIPLVFIIPGAEVERLPALMAMMAMIAFLPAEGW